MKLLTLKTENYLYCIRIVVHCDCFTNYTMVIMAKSSFSSYLIFARKFGGRLGIFPDPRGDSNFWTMIFITILTTKKKVGPYRPFFENQGAEGSP